VLLSKSLLTACILAGSRETAANLNRIQIEVSHYQRPSMMPLPCTIPTGKKTSPTISIAAQLVATQTHRCAADELDDYSVGLVRHMAEAIEDFSEFMAVKNRANPRILIASAALALVELSFKHSKPGEQDRRNGGSHPGHPGDALGLDERATG
jgi:hypothetical protein